MDVNAPGIAPPGGIPSSAPSGRKKGKQQLPSPELSAEQVMTVDESVSELFPDTVFPFLTTPRLCRYRVVCKLWRGALLGCMTELGAQMVEHASAATLQDLVQSSARLQRIEVLFSDRWSVPKTEAIARLINRQQSLGCLSELKLHADTRVELASEVLDALCTIEVGALRCRLHIDMRMIRFVTTCGLHPFALIEDLVLAGHHGYDRTGKEIIRRAFPGLRRVSVGMSHWGLQLAGLEGLTHFAARAFNGWSSDQLRDLLGVPRVFEGRAIPVSESLKVLCLFDAHEMCAPSDFAAFLARHPSLRLFVLSCAAPLPYPLPDPATDLATASRLAVLPHAPLRHLEIASSPRHAHRTVPQLSLEDAHFLPPDVCRRSLEAHLTPPPPPAGPPPASGPGSPEYAADLEWAQRSAGAPLTRHPTALCLSEHSGHPRWDECIVPEAGSPGVVGTSVTDIYLDPLKFLPQQGPSLLLPNLARVHLFQEHDIKAELSLLPDGAPPTDPIQWAPDAVPSRRRQQGVPRQFVETLLRGQGKRIGSVQAAPLASAEAVAFLADLHLLQHAGSLSVTLSGALPALQQHAAQLGALQTLVVRGDGSSRVGGGAFRRFVAKLPRLQKVRVEVSDGAVQVLRQATEGAKEGVVFEC